MITGKSGGALSAEIPAITEFGLKGREVMRLTKLGVFGVALNYARPPDKR